jgi:hypothetical protein
VVTGSSRTPPHTDVGAYALGLLDAAESARFEEHLAGCARCGEELERALGTAALLEELSVRQAVEQPRSDVLVRLLEAVADDRRRGRRRRLLVAGLAAVLVAAGGTTVGALSSGDAASGRPEAAHSAFQHGDTRYAHTDPVTHVEAAVALDRRPWGTQVALRLGNVTGPRTCDLVAVGRNGERGAVASWSVPAYGYGVEGSQWDEPLYVEGAVSLPLDDIARFEVRDRNGERLAVITL